jgi:hypothetical protein
MAEIMTGRKLDMGKGKYRNDWEYQFKQFRMVYHGSLVAETA